MASLDFDTEREAFKEFYAQNITVLKDAASSFRTLLSQLLADHDDFATPQVTCRVKDRDECIAKFSRKYLAKCEELGVPYEIKDHITDLVGLRVVCLYESEVPLIRAHLASGFELVDETDKIQAIEAQEGLFGYKGLHLDLKLLGNRRGLPEYRRFQDIRFEVQLRTTVQDAWSVLDHKIKYKKSIPINLKRRINRLAALFELADQEFLNIRDETRRMEIAAVSAAVTTYAAVTHPPDPVEGATPLDTFSFLVVAAKRYPNYSFSDFKVDGFVTELLDVAPKLSAEELEAAITQQSARMQLYRTYQYERFRNRLNPYTTIRHALYATNRERFSSLLFDLQRATFDSWLEEQDASNAAAPEMAKQ